MTKSQKFSGWSSNKRLAELGEFYAMVSLDPEAVSDAEFVQNITKVFWPTNCWAFVEQAFAIIAPGCAMRPHLVRELVACPIEAMIYGGLTDENEVIERGVAFANKDHPYVEPTPDGRRWLLERWPALAPEVIEIFRQKYLEATS
jgi:hypothetical protein